MFNWFSPELCDTPVSIIIFTDNNLSGEFSPVPFVLFEKPAAQLCNVYSENGICITVALDFY